jgi:hypothetical protein
MSFRKNVDKGLNKFGNSMADLRDAGREAERMPEVLAKGAAKAVVKVPGALAKGGADVGVGVLKELSGILAYGGRELTGSKKANGSCKTNLAKGWFE